MEIEIDNDNSDGRNMLLIK